MCSFLLSEYQHQPVREMMCCLMMCDPGSALHIKMSILATESCINISSVVLLEVSVLLPSGLVTRYCLPWLSIFVHQYAWLATTRTSKCKVCCNFQYCITASQTVLPSLPPLEGGDLPPVQRMLISQSIFWLLPVLGWHYVLEKTIKGQPVIKYPAVFTRQDWTARKLEIFLK